MRDEVRVAVFPRTTALLTTAEKLAQTLHLNLITEEKDAHRYDFLLVVTLDYLGLARTQDKKFSPFYIDFLSAKIKFRQAQASLRKELLARAMGCHPNTHPRIIDATAGLGRDSFLLAALGYEVTMLEISPILHVLLQDALKRARQNPEAAAAISRLTLLNVDANVYLKNLVAADKPDIIYLDPMFPPRKKSALVKKEMVILQGLLPSSPEDADLLKTALACARKRVVIKRPRLGNYFANLAPSFSLEGKSSRFDVYAITPLPPTS